MTLRLSVLLTLLVCNGALKMDSSLAVTELGTVQLLEMKNNLKHKLDLNEMATPGEKKVFEYFKQLIINTSLPRLTFSAEHDNKTILRNWDNIINCSNTLTAHRNVEWSALHTIWTEKKNGLWECRGEQSQCSDSNRTICSECEAMVGNWNPPDTPLPTDRVPVFHTTATAESSELVSYGDDRKFTTLKNWMLEYHNWHCTIQPCPQPSTIGSGTHKDCREECTAACTTEIIECGNTAENCSQLQDEFEVATCNWNDDITISCQQFANCKTDHDNEYNTTIAETHESSRRREVEYQIMKTIVCFIDLLTAETRPTAADKAGCQRQWPMDMFTLYYPHTDYQDEPANVYVPGSSDCTCLTYPAPANGCLPNEVHTDHYSGSIPCTNFVEEYYETASWYHTAPPDTCNPCSSS